MIPYIFKQLRRCNIFVDEYIVRNEFGEKSMGISQIYHKFFRSGAEIEFSADDFVLKDIKLYKRYLEEKKKVGTNLNISIKKKRAIFNNLELKMGIYNCDKI